MSNLSPKQFHTWTQALEGTGNFGDEAERVASDLREFVGEPEDLDYELTEHSPIGYPSSHDPSQDWGRRPAGHVTRLQQAMERGEAIPPVLIAEAGFTRILDGTHRNQAALNAGLEKIPTYIARSRKPDLGE